MSNTEQETPKQENPNSVKKTSEIYPPDEVSYLYGFKTIIKHDMVGKAFVMDLPNLNSLRKENQDRKDIEVLGVENDNSTD